MAVFVSMIGESELRGPVLHDDVEEEFDDLDTWFPLLKPEVPPREQSLDEAGGFAVGS